MSTALDKLKLALVHLDNRYSENWVQVGPTIYGTDAEIDRYNELEKDPDTKGKYKITYSFSKEGYYLKRIRLYIFGKESKDCQCIIEGIKTDYDINNKPIYLSQFSREPKYAISPYYCVLLDTQLNPNFEWADNVFAQGQTNSTATPTLGSIGKMPAINDTKQEVDTVSITISKKPLSTNSYIVVYGVLGKVIPQREEEDSDV